MSPVSTALTTKVESGSPYQLNKEQVSKASKALLKHIKVSEQENSATAGKKSLITEADDEEDDTSTPIWLTLTTKKHIVDQKRLKPARIPLPHPLNTSTTTTICLITADPQRTYKDIVASPAFPKELRARITRVVGVKKIKAKWTQYEAQRKLFAESDIFLADDRVIPLLPKLLGKTFYGSTTKRPIPISLQANAPRTDGKRIARAKGDDPRAAGEAKDIAKEIEKAIHCALVNLSPSTNTAVRVGYANWDSEKLAENIEAVATALIEKFVPKKWRGVKALHVKGPNTAALPIWLADELWVDEKDVLGEEELKKVEEAKISKKRKARGLLGEGEDEQKKKQVKAIKEHGEVTERPKKQKLLVESNDDKLDKEIAARKEKLKKQKAEATLDVEDEVPKVSRRIRRDKAVLV